MTKKPNANVQREPDNDTPPETTESATADVQAEPDGPRVTQPLPAMTEPVAAETAVAEIKQPDLDPDPEATVVRPAVRPGATRPRKTTLAMAIPRPSARNEAPQAASGQGAPNPDTPISATGPESLPEGIEDEVDEWAVADQPTVYLSPRPRQTRPDYLQTGESQTWPPRPVAASLAAQPGRAPTPPAPESTRPASVPTTPTTTPTAPAMPRRDVYSRPENPSGPAGPRIDEPSRNPLPVTPPGGVPRAALANPRMERFQQLRRQRLAHQGGERDPQDARPVAELVRQWWSDLLPGLENALTYQREARASGVHPIPAHVPTTTSRLGDAFGRLAASARDLTGRAQAAAGPRLRRWHDQAEQAAQAIVDRFEGPPTYQQAPFLGPGRIAVFFRQGVTVGQAQRLLAASHARPIRLIPRKHGFLTLVQPGLEAEIGERLRVHPYVRDVAYLEYDEDGQPTDPS